MMVVGDSVAEACAWAIRSVLELGDVIPRNVGNWVFGYKSLEETRCKEVHGMVIVVCSPEKRWHTRVNVPMMVESLDYLLGLNPGYTHLFWKFYNQWRGYDGKYPYTYGERIGECIYDVIELLKYDNSTRHACIPIYRPKDIRVSYQPCNVFIQFLKGKHGLDTIVNVRSQDALRGLYLDTFAYTLLQSVVCKEIGMSAGEYIVMENNIHVYVKDLDKVDRMTAKDFEYNEIPVIDEKFSDVRDILHKCMDDIVNGRYPDDVMSLGKFWKSYISTIGYYCSVKDALNCKEKFWENIEYDAMRKVVENVGGK